MIEGADRDLLERSIEHAVSTADVDAALDDLGWDDALAADPRVAISMLFAHQGGANAKSSALNRVLAHALGAEGTVVLPRVGQWQPPASGRLVDGIATTPLQSTAVVVGDTAFAVDASTLAQRAVSGMDPDLGLIGVTGDLTGASEVGPVNWRAAVALGQLALGHELVGASRRMLELARQHALDRVQFGRPIAAFQAVRHRLAETLVAIETAEAMLDAAWLDGHPQTAGMAKAVAGRSARTAAKHCQQVLAGIGFTTEHDLHRYVRRIFVLEQLLGSTKLLTRELGVAIIDRGELPALLPL